MIDPNISLEQQFLRADVKANLDMSGMNQIREILELLYAVELIEYHNRNWLPMFAVKDPAQLSEEKLSLLEQGLFIVGSSAKRRHT